MIKLYADCKTDAERASFFRVGRGWESGIVAKSLERDLADVFAFRAAAAAALAALEPNADWADLTLAVHSAMVQMGSFQNPLEEGLKGLTPAQWQLEQAKRQARAVITKLGLEER